MDRRTGSTLNAVPEKQQSIAVCADRRQLRSNAPPVKKFWLRHWNWTSAR